MALIKHFNAYIAEKLPFFMQILELFKTGDSVKGKVLWYENQINKNFNKTRGNALNMYGSGAFQLFEPLKRGSKINYESLCTNSNCICNGTRTHNHLVRKRTLNHLAKLAK